MSEVKVLHDEINSVIAEIERYRNRGPALDLFYRLAARARELEGTGGSEWTCVACGNSDPERFRGITYPGTPNSAEEYDMECCECGSMEIEESPLCALHQRIRNDDNRIAQLEAAVRWGFYGFFGESENFQMPHELRVTLGKLLDAWIIAHPIVREVIEKGGE